MKHNFKSGQKVRIVGTANSGAVDEMKRMVGGVYKIQEASEMYVILKNYAWDHRDLENVENNVQNIEPENKEPLFFNTENLIQ